MWIIGYWIFPVVSALTWLGMLLAMFIDWEVLGHPIYPSMDDGQKIAYISDIGAEGLKPLFIAGCCVTTVFLDLSFASERWLRHTGRLARNLGKGEKVLSIFSMIFAVAGTCGLILLSIFDTLHHPHLHDGFLLLFIAGYVISAIFITAEYQRLGIHFRHHRILRISFWIKLVFIVVEIILAICFASLTFTKHKDEAAVFEWVIALIFTFYVFSFLIDLLPAVRTKHHVPQGLQDAEMQMRLGHHVNGNGVGGGGEYQQPLTQDSAGPYGGANGVNGHAANGVNGVNGTNGASYGDQRHKPIGTQHF